MPGITRLAILWTVLTAAAGACKPKALPTSAANPQFPFPQRLGATSDATALTRIGALPRDSSYRLVLDLQRLPPAGSPNPFACWHVPDDAFLVGHAVCTSGSGQALEIAAANVDEICTTSPDFTPVKAKTPLPLEATCDTYDVFEYAFDQPLPLSISKG